MAYKRITVDPPCKDAYTCPSVWIDDEEDPEYAIVVGPLLEVSPVPLSAGEVAVRVRRAVIRDAEL